MRKPIVVAAVIIAAVAVTGAYQVHRKNRKAREHAATVARTSAADRAALQQQLAALAETQGRYQAQIANLESELEYARTAQAAPLVQGAPVDQTGQTAADVGRLEAELAQLRAQQAQLAAQAADMQAGGVPTTTYQPAPVTPSSSLSSSVPSAYPTVGAGGDLQAPSFANGVTVYGPGNFGTATVTTPTANGAGGLGISNGAAPMGTPGNGGVMIPLPTSGAPIGTPGAGGVTQPTTTSGAPLGTPGSGGTFSPPAPGVTTSAPAPGVTTSAPAPGVTSSAPAPGVSSSPPAPGVSSSPPAPGVAR